MRLLLSRPSYLLNTLWLLCVAACAATAWLALQEPWLGVKMATDGEKVRVIAASSQQIPLGAEVRRLSFATNSSLDIRPADLILDTDTFESYAAKEEFFKRQTALNDILHSHEVRLVWLSREGNEQVTALHPRQRTLSSLSAMFWFTLVVIATAFIISVWVYLVRPQDWATRMFALSGLGLFIAGIAAALLGERVLALNGSWMQLFEASNTLMAYVFGGALISLLLTYPRPLLAPKNYVWIFTPYFAWWVLDQAHYLPSPAWGALPAVMSIVILMFSCGWLQWKHTNAQPLERAALRWFLLSILLSGGIFALTSVVPRLFGLSDLLPVGYAIGSFLILYLGIALGLRRYRLFDIDEWSYRVFLWVAGATSVIVLDALLIFTGVTESASLGFTLLVCGWLYFPFRQWLWQRMVVRHTPGVEYLLPKLSAIAFSNSAHEQQARWKTVLTEAFGALEVKPSSARQGVGVADEGLSLHVEACGVLPAFTLSYAGGGARLFSSRDAEFAKALSLLLEQMMGGRTSYEQGVAQERLRIGRDLHDNIGARLLKLIHHLRGTPNAEIARDAMKDLRTSIAAMDSQPVLLCYALADWRAEARARCEVANCQLHWNQEDDVPAVELLPRTKGTLESVMREVITNALKHAAPSSVRVKIVSSEGQLRIEVGNDGNITDPFTWKEGYGLRNIRGRMEELGGNMTIVASTNEVRLRLGVPLT